MQSWPETLPQSPYVDISIKQMSGYLSAEETLNPVRTRTYPDYEGTFQFKQITIVQLHTLRTFYNDTLNQTKPFTAPWLTDLAFNHHFCMFSKPPEVRRDNKGWNVSINVVIISGVPVDGETIQYGMNV